MTAAERDEILAMRDESDAALENMGAKVDAKVRRLVAELAGGFGARS